MGSNMTGKGVGSGLFKDKIGGRGIVPAYFDAIFKAARLVKVTKDIGTSHVSRVFIIPLEAFSS